MKTNFSFNLVNRLSIEYILESVDITTVISQSRVCVYRYDSGYYSSSPKVYYTPYSGQVLVSDNEFVVSFDFPINTLNLAEPEDTIRLWPGYNTYVDWAKKGYGPPPVDVFYRVASDQLVAVGRRRLLAARDANVESLVGYFRLSTSSSLFPLVIPSISIDDEGFETALCLFDGRIYWLSLYEFEGQAIYSVLGVGSDEGTPFISPFMDLVRMNFRVFTFDKSLIQIVLSNIGSKISLLKNDGSFGVSDDIKSRVKDN